MTPGARGAAPLAMGAADGNDGADATACDGSTWTGAGAAGWAGAVGTTGTETGPAWTGGGDA